MCMQILILILKILILILKILFLNFFLEIKENKITRGHNYTLVKKQSRLDVRKFFHRGPSMYGITYQLIV